MPRRHLNKETFDLIALLHQRGQSGAEIAAIFNVSPSVVNRALTRFQQTGSARRRPGSGSERKTNQRQDRYIRIQTRMNPFRSAVWLQTQLRAATGVRVSDQTIRNRLREMNLHSCRPVRRPKLTNANRMARRAWVNQRLAENFQWEHGLYTDESRFCLFSDNRRVRVWRTRGDRYRREFAKAVVPFGGGGIMVWAGISLNGRTNLHLFENNVNGHIYRDDIIQQYVVDFREAVDENMVFIDDNARPHRAQIVMQAINDLHINHLPLPPTSPDLNPIEHIWDRLQEQLNEHNPPPVNVQHLREILPLCWRRVSQEHINNCIMSMPRRCTAVRDVRGHYTRY